MAPVAKRLGVDRSWVYEHAGDLGAISLSDGPRPRLRFNLDVVDRWLEERRTA